MLSVYVAMTVAVSLRVPRYLGRPEEGSISSHTLSYRWL